MVKELFPAVIPNWISGRECPALSGEVFDKLSPANGKLLCRAARSRAEDIDRAVQAAAGAQPAWAETPPVQRGLVLHDIVLGMKSRREEIAGTVAAETGKSFKDALGETGGGHAPGGFYAREGQRP